MFVVLAFALLAAASAQTTTTEAPTFGTKVVTITIEADFTTTSDAIKAAIVDQTDEHLAALYGTEDVSTTLSEGSIIATTIVTDPTVLDPEVTAITYTGEAAALTGTGSAIDEEDAAPDAMGMGMGAASADASDLGSGDRTGDEFDMDMGKGGSGSGAADRMGGGSKGKGSKGSKGKGSKGGATLVKSTTFMTSRTGVATLSAGVVLVAGLGLIAVRANSASSRYEVISGDDDEQPVVAKDVNEFSALLV